MILNLYHVDYRGFKIHSTFDELGGKYHASVEFENGKNLFWIAKRFGTAEEAIEDGKHVIDEIITKVQETLLKEGGAA